MTPRQMAEAGVIVEIGFEPDGQLFTMQVRARIGDRTIGSSCAFTEAEGREVAFAGKWPLKAYEAVRLVLEALARE